MYLSTFRIQRFIRLKKKKKKKAGVGGEWGGGGGGERDGRYGGRSSSYRKCRCRRGEISHNENGTGRRSCVNGRGTDRGEGVGHTEIAFFFLSFLNKKILLSL